MMKFWLTHKNLQAHLDSARFLYIPPDEMVEEAHRFENGDVRIFWKKNTEGLGGLTVRDTDLQACAHIVD